MYLRHMFLADTFNCSQLWNVSLCTQVLDTASDNLMRSSWCAPELCDLPGQLRDAGSNSSVFTFPGPLKSSTPNLALVMGKTWETELQDPCSTVAQLNS